MKNVILALIFLVVSASAPQKTYAGFFEDITNRIDIQGSYEEDPFRFYTELAAFTAAGTLLAAGCALGGCVAVGGVVALKALAAVTFTASMALGTRALQNGNTRDGIYYYTKAWFSIPLGAGLGHINNTALGRFGVTGVDLAVASEAASEIMEEAFFDPMLETAVNTWFTADGQFITYSGDGSDFHQTVNHDNLNINWSQGDVSYDPNVWGDYEPGDSEFIIDPSYVSVDEMSYDMSYQDYQASQDQAYWEFDSTCAYYGQCD